MNDKNPFTSEIFSIDWSYKKKKSNSLDIQNIAESLDNFSKEMINETGSKEAKVLLENQLEISRPGESLVQIEEDLEAYKVSSDIGNSNLDLRLSGKNNIKLMIIGDFYKEKANNEIETVFSSQAADLLGKMLSAMGLTQDQYLIAAVGLSEGKPEGALESIKKEAYFFKPEVIMPMGSVATQTLLNSTQRLSKLQGKLQERTWAYPKLKKNFKIIPIFHPEYLLINPTMKRLAWDGMKRIIEEFS